ncbi:hypothetical protein [Labedaea rhizosphaerae]|uniref:Uncharacterized protein n=1 Tax=Labedaea rhizosphaerae TaxID=598644 RepID=A0A4R6RUV3_LABRH|nr:hypothetical protein [Labedaea rhizosphaerae]TDP90524.1 hypothetical protein EV186_11064 [Labedaea rhizosphaerae]
MVNAITSIPSLGLRDLDRSLPWSNMIVLHGVAFRDETLRGRVRATLRPHCGPGQDLAETLAEACVAVHCPDDDAPHRCAECAEAWPCQSISAELITLGVFV